MMGGKKKRQETTLLSSSSSLRSSSLRSSSYRQDSVSPNTHQSNHVKSVNVGCMSGIFHLMSKYHTHRKFLTFGRIQERNAPTSPPPVKAPTPKSDATVTCQKQAHGSSPGILSLDQAPRSSVLPAEIRRSSTESLTSSPRVVARLMGIDDFPVTPPAAVVALSPAAEKRRKLLGALEKCDEDLKALKKIIEAVRATQTPPRAVKMERREVVEKESEVGSDEDEPSPVSVLDHHHLSSGYTKRTTNDHLLLQHQQQKPRQQKQQITKKRPGDLEEKAINFLNKPPSSVALTTTLQPLHLPTTRITQQLFNSTATTPPPAAAPPQPWSTAMRASVIEVCRDLEWGQRQEVGRIGSVIQDLILRELIDELTKGLGSCFHVCSSPFEAYKRKLCF